jgi:2-polyprenyl-3-methyl-5-hydroxy-6-metoxy-1,4-benzoquinol methylase
MNALLADRARRALGVEVMVGDITSATMGPRRFDVITAFDLLEHLLDPVGVIKRCADILAPGGHLAIYTPNHSSVIARTAALLFSISGGRIRKPVTEIFDGLHVVFFDRRTLRLSVEQAPLQIVETALIKYDPGRSKQAGTTSAAALRVLEAVSPLVNGQFRIFLIARKVTSV